MIRHKPSFIFSLLLAAITVALDQWLKWYMLQVINIAGRPPIEVTSFFNLVMVWNRGVSFGMFASAGQPMLLAGLAAVITIVLLVWLARSHDRLVTLGVGFVIGGAIGNVIDRFRFGAVADFFDFHAFGYHWPAFNIADSAIFIGVVVLCIQSMMQPAKTLS